MINDLKVMLIQNTSSLIEDQQYVINYWNTCNCSIESGRETSKKAVT